MAEPMREERPANTTIQYILERANKYPEFDKSLDEGDMTLVVYRVPMQARFERVDRILCYI